MRTVWLVLRKDMLRRLRSPISSIVYLLFPFLFSGLIALAFGSGDNGQTPQFQLALVNEDDGFISRFVVGAFGQEQLAEIFEATECDLPRAEKLIKRNKVSGAIVIPPGFSEAILEGEPAHLRVIKNPAQAIGPVAIEELAGMFVQLLDGGARVLGGPLDEIARLSEETQEQSEGDPWAFPADDRIAEIASTINQNLRGVQRFAFPPVVTLREGDPAVESAGEEPEGQASTGASRMRTIFNYVLPGMATFALMLLSLGFVADIPRERTMGTLSRQLVAPVSAGAVMTGKLLSAVVMGLLIAFAMAAIGYFILDVRADLPAFLVLCLAYVSAATGVLAMLFGIARSEQQGATLSSILVIVMSMLGGAWFPLDNMPAFMRNVAPATINYWGIRGFREIMMHPVGLEAVATPALVLFGLAAAGTLVGSVLMNRRLMRGV